MSMIAPVKLDDLLSPSKGSHEAEHAHARLPRVDGTQSIIGPSWWHSSKVEQAPSAMKHVSDPDALLRSTRQS